MTAFQLSNVAKAVHDNINKLWDEQLLFLKALGSYKSTLGNEAEIQWFIYNHLTDMGLSTSLFDIDPQKIAKYKNYGVPEWSYENRPVVVGELKRQGAKFGKSLILQGHIDVVSAEPNSWWKTDPYCPVIINNKMYGRGICDMKSGISAMIYALKAIQKENITLGADIQIQTVIEEECTGNGALALLDAGFTADGALIPEPTALRIQKSIVGIIWMRVEVFGDNNSILHSENPINKAVYLMEALDKYRIYINKKSKHKHYTSHPHPLNVNVGTIRGGDWPSKMPFNCSFEVRVGFYPNQNPEDIKSELKEWLMDAVAQDEWLREQPPNIDFFGFSAHGIVSTLEDDDMISTLKHAHMHTTNQKAVDWNFTGTTDTRVFQEFGIPTTCYGPKGENMHGANEFVYLETLKTTTKTIATFILEWCNNKKI